MKRKLALNLLRVKGKLVSEDTWSTMSDNVVLGKHHELFESFKNEQIYIADKHVEIKLIDDNWVLCNLHSKYNVSVNDQPIGASQISPIKFGDTIEIGLCQLKVQETHLSESRQELYQLLAQNTPHSEGKKELLLQDTGTGDAYTITPTSLQTKTTFEDMGLGVDFDVSSFFDEITSDSSLAKGSITEKDSYTAAPSETDDILKQLAIESEIAIINPAILNRQTDYWHSERHQDQITAQPIQELEHLFALDTESEERMVPLDNLQKIQTLLHQNENINGVINNLQPVTEYQLFAAETHLEPLRLFHYDKADALPMQNTPEFTQKEHHISSMDGYFTAPFAHNASNAQPNTAAQSMRQPKVALKDPFALTQDILELIPNPTDSRNPK